MKLIDQIKSARRAAVPILAINTTDSAVTTLAIQKALNGDLDTTPLMEWDAIRALHPLNPAGRSAIQALTQQPERDTANPAACLKLLAKTTVLDGQDAKVLPEDSIIIFHNAHLLLKQGRDTNLMFVQGAWNLRDEFKARGCMLVFLGVAFSVPPELLRDTVLLEDKLPLQDELADIVNQTFINAGLPTPDDATRSKIVDVVVGMNAFEAETALAMCITKNGMNMPELWERKCKAIDEIPGLKVYRGKETYADIGGCDNAKQFLGDIIHGNDAPRCVVFCDEIEKAIGNHKGDTSNVSSDFLGAILKYMQDKDACGVILIGPPGAAKSAISKATGNEGGVPTIEFDLGAMKGSLVGQSEQQLRQALNVIDAVSQQRALWVATCNAIATLPPELRRRFSFGTFFFDLPTKEEREKIWAIMEKKFDIAKQERPVDTDWTGAEIRECCRIAYRLNKPLKHAASYITPVAITAADQIQSLREQANGRFISANHTGFFRVDESATETQTTKPAVTSGRKIRN